MEVKYRIPGHFKDLRILGFELIKQEKRADRIQVYLATPVVQGSGKKTEILNADFAVQAKSYWRSKLSVDDFKALREIGFKSGATVDIYAAIDNWLSRNENGVNGGTWFQILKVEKINYQPCDFSLLSQTENRFSDDPFSDDLGDSIDSLESQIDDELGEFDAA